MHPTAVTIWGICGYASPEVYKKLKKKQKLFFSKILNNKLNKNKAES